MTKQKKSRIHRVVNWIATIVVACSMVIGPFLMLSIAIFAWPIPDPDLVQWMRDTLIILVSFIGAVLIIYAAIAYGPVVKRHV